MPRIARFPISIKVVHEAPLLGLTLKACKKLKQEKKRYKIKIGVKKHM
jgi:hypothetical protein